MGLRLQKLPDAPVILTETGSVHQLQNTAWYTHSASCWQDEVSVVVKTVDITVVSSCVSDALPSIPQVQALIEEAWTEGIDPQGSSQFNRRLKGTRAWIGATEIYAVLTSLHLR